MFLFVLQMLMTPVHMAAQLGHVGVLRVLIKDYHADVMVQAMVNEHQVCCDPGISLHIYQTNTCTPVLFDPVCIYLLLLLYSPFLLEWSGAPPLCCWWWSH